MHAKRQWNDVVGKNLKSFCDVEVILRLPCILPLLECVHVLIKVAQVEMFLFVTSWKLWRGPNKSFTSLYCDPYTKFEDPTFDDFNAIEALTNSNLPMEWFFDLNYEEDYLAFFFASHKYLVYYNNDDGVGDLQPITKIAFNQTINKVKDECKGVAHGLVFELEKQFPEHEVMTILGVIHPQF